MALTHVFHVRPYHLRGRASANKPRTCQKKEKRTLNARQKPLCALRIEIYQTSAFAVFNVEDKQQRVPRFLLEF